MSRELISALLRRGVPSVLLLFVCSYCGGDSIAGPDTTIVSITLTPPSATVRLGATVQLTAAGVNAANASVVATPVFTSSDASVVQVSSTGLARALKLGSATVTAKVGSVEKSAGITVIAGFPSTLTKVAGDNLTATVQSAVSAAPSVVVKDSVGNPVEGAAVAFAVASGGGSIAGATATSNASGTATAGAWTLGSAAGTNTLTASVAGASTAVTTTFTATGAALVASKLAITTLATAAVSGTPLNPQPVVEIRNSAGTLVASATNAVTMSVVASGGLIGTTTVNAVAGVARFAGVAFGSAGTQTVTFSSPNLEPASGSVVVAQGAQLRGDTLSFSATRGTQSLEGKLVQVTNAGDVTAPVVSGVGVGSITYDATGTGWLKVTILKSSTPATLLIEPQLTGLSSGVHVAQVNVTAPGATPGLITVTMNVIPLPAVSLAVVTQPKGGKKTEPLIVNPVVEFRDSLGLVATQSVDTVTVRILNGTGTLTGQTTVVAVAGVATFTNLKLSDAGTFTLIFESTGGLPPVNSLNFVVTAANTLLATVVPTSIVSGAAMTPPIEISTLDFTTQLVTNEVNLVTVSLQGVDGAIGTLGGFTSAATSGGKAVFADLTLSGHGTFDLTFSAPGLSSAVVRIVVP